ncbi:hypothetical protein ES708_26642 [subsurface metagenome]
MNNEEIEEFFEKTKEEMLGVSEYHNKGDKNGF